MNVTTSENWMTWNGRVTPKTTQLWVHHAYIKLGVRASSFFVGFLLLTKGMTGGKATSAITQLNRGNPNARDVRGPGTRKIAR